MKTTRILALMFAFVVVLFGNDAGAATAFTTFSMGAAPTAWTNQIWKVNSADTFSNAPFAGTNYIAISNGIAQSGNVNNTRLRNPAVDGTINFPGDSLTLQTNTDIRFKKGAAAGPPFPFISPTITRFPGVGGNAGLILNGGSLNPGDDATFPIAGSIQVLTDSLFGMGDGNIQAVNGNRGFQVQASLTGTGSLIVLNGHTNFACVEVTSANNDTYTGTWIVKAGWLKGTASRSLGKGNITLDTSYNVVPTGLITAGGAVSLTNGPIRFEVSYDLDTPGTLTVASGDAQVVLHQNVRVAKLFVDGNPIPNGTYDYATAAATFPTHIVGGGSGSISVGPATPSGLVALPGDTQNVLSWTGSSGATGYVIYRSLSTGVGTNGTSIFTNGTATTYTDTTLVNGTQYFYAVSEINSGGESTNSVEASATPGQFAPVIGTDVANATACTTTTASFSVGVTNTFPVVYQWYYNTNTLLPNQTNSTYSTNNVQLANAGTYSVVVTNNFGSVTSSFAVLTVKALTVASTPGNQTICPGSPVTFTTTATGAGSLTYTWRKAGAVVQGPDGNNSFTIASVSAGDAATYSVTVIGDCNTISNNFTLTVVAAPVITANPQSQTSPMYNGVVFSVTATSALTPGYQWQTNGVNVTGATSSTFTMSNLSLSLNGTLVRVVVSNCASTATSTAATLTVTPISGVSFDFNTRGQWTNAPYNMFDIDWGNNTLVTVTHFPPVVPFEVSTGGVGTATGGGGLDLALGSGTVNSSTLNTTPFDFTLAGQTLVASVTIKVKTPLANSRAVQLGFTSATNLDLDGTAGRFYMSAILESLAQPGMGFDIRQGNKPTGTFFEGNSNTMTLTSNQWYRLTATFVNTSTNSVAAAAGTYQMSYLLENLGLDGLASPSTVGSVSGITVTNADIVTSKSLWLVVRDQENCGVDFLDNVYAYTKSGSIFWVQQPSNQTVSQGGIATFRARVDGAGPYTYQWSKNGTPIVGAGNWKYTTPQALTNDDGAQYTVTITGPDATVLTSSPATLTVLPKSLDVLSVGSVDGSIIGLRFNQPVTTASANTAANYTINGVPALVAQLRVFNPLNAMQQLRTNATEVLLTPASPVSGSYTVVVANVTSISGTALSANNTAVGTVVGLTSYDVDPIGIRFNGQVGTLPGYTYSFASNALELVSGGHDIFGNFDGFHFVYKQITGDFDLKMRIPYLDPLRTPTKAGFNARISLDASSPNVGAYADPMQPGRNFFEGGFRTNYNQASSSWGNQPATVYPNVWLRFRRAGDTFMRYSSQNGINWQFDGQINPATPGGMGTPFPATLYVGVAGNCNVGTGALQQHAVSQYDSFGNFAGYPGSVIAITAQPANATVAAGASVNISGLTATLTGGGAPTSAGELSYLWQRTNTAGGGGWTNVPTAGATNNILTTGAMFGGDNGAQFRAIVSAPGAAPVTSAVVTLTVTDAVVPTVAQTFVVSNSPNQIIVYFSEVMNATALNAANYAVSNINTLVTFGIRNVSFLNGDRRTVVLTTSNALTGGIYTVRVNGVQDGFGNTIVAANPQAVSLGTASLYPIVMEAYLTVGTANTIADLTNSAKFLANTPDYTTYSNVFGRNHSAATFPAPAGLDDTYGVKMYTYFVPTNTANFIFWWRGDDYASFSMNTNAVGSTNPAGRVFGNNMTINNPSYQLTNSFVTPLLNAGQAYYVEFDYKEGTGGDGGTVMVTVGSTTNGVTPPAATTVAPGNLFVFPDGVAPRPKALLELYTGLTTTLTAASGTIADMFNATNLNKFIVGQPDLIAYMKHFGFETNLGNTRFDNYAGRLISYFIPPTNGNYKFYLRSDDSSLLYLNTNSVNSTDPAGKSLIGRLDAFTAAYTLGTNPITLIGGQRYYMEGVWREGGGGDGMDVAVRAQSDASVPSIVAGLVEMIPSSMLEYPTNLDRIGPVNFNQAGSAGGIAPMNPTITDGQSMTFFARGLAGSPPYLGFMWFKNGQPVQANNAYWVTQPFTLADNGAVITLLVSNVFSVATATSIVTVLPDSVAPTIVSAAASQFGDTVLITFSEQVDSVTSTRPENYQIGGLTVLSVGRDDVNRNRVSLRTSPQTPGVTYTVTVNGVRDISSAGNLIAANSTKNFTAWGFGGLGTVYVEVFTNIASTTVDAFFTDPKGVYNMPDISYYTNTFSAGNFNANSGPLHLAENWAARLTGLFMPPSNGLYRFYIRGDDGTRLYMNTNGPSPSGRVLVARNDGANSGATATIPSPYLGGLGLGFVGASGSPILSLTNGTPYYMEALMKEGGGGDYVTVVMRAIDAATLTEVGGLPTAAAAGDSMGGGFFQTTGNPDVNQLLIVSQPPAELFLTENDPVSLVVGATTTPPSLTPYVFYQWQRSNSMTGTFTNIPGATTLSLSFYAPLADDGATYRLVASIPGQTRSITTLLHVAEDVTAPEIISVSSIDGYTVGVLMSEPIQQGIAGEGSNWHVDYEAVDVSSAVVLASDPRKWILNLSAPISGDLTVEAFDMRDNASGIHDFAPGNPSPYLIATGAVQNVTTQFIASTTGNVAGGYNPSVPSSSFTFTNAGFDVSANGYDIWNAADAFQFTYRQVTGNFDIKTRVQKLVGADQWSKAGLMARATTNASSRNVMVLTTPTTTPVPGQLSNNFFGFQWRDIDGAASLSFAGSQTNPPAYPNAWMRLQRSNSVFYSFFGTNGTDWTFLQSHDTSTNAFGAFPDTLQVGMATVSHDQTPGRALANNAYAEYRDLYFPVGAAITQQPEPSPVTIGIHQSVSFSNLIASGVGVLYQWRNNGVAIPNATNANFTLINAAVSDSGFYTVLVYNDGGGQVSSPLQLIVTNTLPVLVNDTLSATQNTSVTFPTTALTGNDSDAELDPVSLLAVYYPHVIATNFDAGMLSGATLYGDAHLSNGVPTATSQAVVLNDSIGNNSGSLVLNEITPGAKLLAFTASFNLRVADPSAQPADGFSFNFGNDLPTGSLTATQANTGIRNAEDGVTTTGFSFCVDDYQFATWPAGGTAFTSGMKIRYNNIDIAGVQCRAWASNAVFVPVTITVELNGKLTVLVDGTNVFGNVTLPWVPQAGRFGLYARCGGQTESHVIDDLNISLISGDTALGGLVDLSGGNVTYTPPAAACSAVDTFYYLASDGQLGGTNVGTVTVNVVPTNAPVITTCVTNRTYAAGASCTATLPDLRGELVVSSCSAVSIGQSPAPGSSLALGPNVVTFTVTNTGGVTATCQATITVADTTAPVAICPANITTPATSGLGAVVTFSPSGTDNCSVASVIANPASGSTFPIGVTTVTVTATDGSGNTNACTFTVTVTSDGTPPVINCPTNRTVVCSGTNAIATYTPTATDNIDPNPTVIVTPPSGSSFPVGTNTVLVTAYDSSGNTNTCTFLVIVTDPLANNISLTIEQSGTNVVITWPQTCTSYVLERTSDLNPTVTWSPVAAPVVPVGSNFQVTVPANTPEKFYRLHKQ